MERVSGSNLMRLIKHLAGFGVGIYGVREYNGESDDEVIKKIMEKGIMLVDNYQSINGNVKLIGVVGEDDSIIESSLRNHKSGHGLQNNIIVAYPRIIQNSRGEKLYLGYPEKENRNEEDTSCSFMDYACSKIRIYTEGIYSGLLCR